MMVRKIAKQRRFRALVLKRKQREVLWANALVPCKDFCHSYWFIKAMICQEPEKYRWGDLTKTTLGRRKTQSRVTTQTQRKQDKNSTLRNDTKPCD